MTERDKPTGDSGVFGLVLGSMTMGMAISAGLGFFHQSDNKPIIDCGNGITDASLDLILQNNQSLLTEPISGIKNISVVEESDGSLTINMYDNSVTTNLPSGETIVASKLQIKPNASVSLEDEHLVYDIKNVPAKNGSEVQLHASCKN